MPRGNHPHEYARAGGRAVAAAMRAEQERLDTVAMMQQPERWPRWPYLPLKRRKASGALPDVGLFLDGPAIEPVRVYLDVSVFSEPAALLDALNGARFEEFPTLAAAVAAGWVVD